MRFHKIFDHIVISLEAILFGSFLLLHHVDVFDCAARAAQDFPNDWSSCTQNVIFFCEMRSSLFEDPYVTKRMKGYEVSQLLYIVIGQL